MQHSNDELLSQGLEQLQAGNYDVALSLFEQIIAQDPQHLGAWYQKGMVLQKLGRYGEAIVANERFSALTGAYQKVDRGLKNLPQKPLFDILQQSALTELLHEQGIQQIQLGKLEDAIASFDKVLEIKPYHYTAWNNRGIILYDHLAHYKEAIINFNKALEIKPDYFHAWYNRGVVLATLNRYEEAIASYDRALKIKPDYFHAWHNRGVALANLNRYEEAIDSFDKALEVQPNDSLVWNNRGMALADLNRYEEAIDSFDKALQLNHDNYAAWINRGVALTNLNRYEEAIGSFDKALEVQPNDSLVWYNRGIALTNFNRYEEAIDSFDKVLEVQPNDSLVWYNRGIALTNLNRYEEAIASFDKALQFNHDNYAAWINRGAALIELHHYEEAIASFDKALQFKPDLYQAWSNRGVAVLRSPTYNQLPFLIVEAKLSQKYPQLDQRGYAGQVITLEFGLTQVTSYSEGWGVLQRELGKAHFDQGKREQQKGYDASSSYWEKAWHCLKLALSVLTTEDFPHLRLKTLEIMIRLLLAQGESATAQSYRKTGVELLQTLLNKAPTAFQKQQIEVEFSDFSQIEVDVWLQVREPITAIKTAEVHKNRCLTWILEAWQETVVSPDYDAIKSLCNEDTALVYWHLSPDGLATFLILDSNETPTILPGDRTAQAQQLTIWLNNWQNDYHDYASKKIPQSDRQNHPWRQNLEHRLTQLNEILQIEALIEALCQGLPSSIQNLILVPHRDLHLLPLHTLFPEHLKCTYLPSAQIGLNLNNRSNDIPTYIPLLSIEDPSTEQAPMPFAQFESAIVRHLVKVATPINSAQATTANVLNHLQNPFATLHFTGHSAYNSHRPQDSALSLADGLLTAETIAQQNLSSYKLIVLSACETALTGNNDIRTEYVGLASAFLKAGAATVLSTLWPVDEISSCWFIICFYQNLLQEKTPAVALYNARQWLRTVTIDHLISWIEQLSHMPDLGYRWQKELIQEIQNLENRKGKLDTIPLYAHPFYWAPFILTGRGT